MESARVPVSYRNKETGETVSLGEIDVDKPQSVEEAIALYSLEHLLEYAHTAYVIEKQRQHRDANRPDKPKSISNLAKFKQLSQEKQEALLKEAGLIQ